MIEVGIMFMPLLFFPLTSNDWNNLTFDPADAPSLDTFTRKLRKTSDQDTLEYKDSEHSSGMSDYASRSAVKISIMINKILTKTVKKGGEARGVTRKLTVEWFDHIHRHLTLTH